MITKKVLPPTKTISLENFCTLFRTHSDQTGHMLLERILKETNFLDYLKQSYEPQEAIERQENVKELLHAVASMSERGITTVESFLEEVALLQEPAHVADKHNSVKLMTIHAAKGLEFDTVIITGLEEGIFPSSRSILNSDALEEERRLFYVGITRAQEYLLITHASYRYTYGTMTQQHRSRFLEELENSTGAIYDDVSYWQTREVQHFFMQWFGDKKAKTLKNHLEPVFVTKTSQSKLYEQQKVSHKKFGVGVIERLEENNHRTYVTVRFNGSIKKISSEFLTPLY